MICLICSLLLLVLLPWTDVILLHYEWGYNIIFWVMFNGSNIVCDRIKDIILYPILCLIKHGIRLVMGYIIHPIFYLFIIFT